MVLQVAVPDVQDMLGLLPLLRLKVEVRAAPCKGASDNLVLLPLEADREALRQVLKIILVRRHFEDGNMDWCEEAGQLDPSLGALGSSIFPGQKNRMKSSEGPILFLFFMQDLP